MLSFAFFIHVKLPAANGYLGCARNAGKAYLSFPLVGIFVFVLLSTPLNVILASIINCQMLKASM